MNYVQNGGGVLNSKFLCCRISGQSFILRIIRAKATFRENDRENLGF